MASRIAILLVGLGVLLSQIHCAGSKLQGNRMDLQRATLPETTADLVQLSDQMWSTSRDLKTIARGAAALEKAQKGATSFEVQWRLSRHYAAISEHLNNRRLRSKFINKALDHAKRAIELDSNRPEGYGALAVAHGFHARHMLAPGTSIQKRIENSAEHLYDNHPRYESGLGHRILGGLYTQAPPWPAGVGDLEGAIEILEENLEMHPHSTLSLFLLGEAYLKMGYREKAKECFRAVLQAKREGEWKLVGAPYRSKARNHLAALQGGNGS